MRRICLDGVSRNVHLPATVAVNGAESLVGLAWTEPYGNARYRAVAPKAIWSKECSLCVLADTGVAALCIDLIERDLQIGRFPLAQAITFFLSPPCAPRVKGSPWVKVIGAVSALSSKTTALARTPDQAAASGSHPVDFTMNYSRVWQTIAAGARPCADALISAFRA